MTLSDHSPVLITDDASGVFVVWTADGSIHHLDMNRRTLLSRGEIGESVSTAMTEVRVNVRTLATCCVGAPMVALIDRGAAGVWFTRRVTSPVTGIRQTVTDAEVAGPSDAP